MAADSLTKMATSTLVDKMRAAMAAELPEIPDATFDLKAGEGSWWASRVLDGGAVEDDEKQVMFYACRQLVLAMWALHGRPGQEEFIDAAMNRYREVPYKFYAHVCSQCGLKPFEATEVKDALAAALKNMASSRCLSLIHI